MRGGYQVVQYLSHEHIPDQLAWPMRINTGRSTIGSALSGQMSCSNNLGKVPGRRYVLRKSAGKDDHANFVLAYHSYKREDLQIHASK